MAFDLSSLLRDVPDLGTNREQIEYIRLELLDEDPNNFYKLSEIPELAANIQLCGLQQPIRVRRGDGDRFQIVSGHRRRAAVALLAEDDPKRWEEVACIVETDTISSAMQELRLIFANASTRKMTDAETAQEAAKVKELLYYLKEVEGYEFPGRMRDHVAEVVGISKSKLSRLEAVESKLSAVWRPAWTGGELSENAAYELCKLSAAWQDLLFEEKQRTGAKIKYLYADDIKKFAERASGIEAQLCKDPGEQCKNCENKLRKAATADRWGWFYCDSKCCRDCPELLRCKKACPKLKDMVRAGRDAAKQSDREAKERQAEKDRPGAEFARRVYERIGNARTANHVSVQRLYEAQKKIFSASIDEPKQKVMESGKGDYSPSTYLPFGYSMRASELMVLVDVADALGCSIDYLLGRTNEMSSVPKPGTIWHPISEEPPTDVDLVWLDYCGYSDTAKYLGCQTISLESTITWEEARWWAKLPTEE